MGRFDSIQTAEQMIAYCEEYKLGTGASPKKDLKNFMLIEQNLMPGEKVLTVFEGIHNYHSMTVHNGYFAYAITDKRFLMAQQRMLGSVVQSVNLNNVNDITMGRGIFLGVVTIDTTKERFNVCVGKKFVSNVHNFVQRTLNAIKEEQQEGQAKKEGVSEKKESFSGDLIELKKLLDMEIITQEEFDAKKKQILGI